MDSRCFNCGSHLPTGTAICAMCGALGDAPPQAQSEAAKDVAETHGPVRWAEPPLVSPRPRSG
jgi:hypothetical protein